MTWSKKWIIPAFFAVACNYGSKEQFITYDTIPSPEVNRPALPSMHMMVFSGKLPCADCGGIETMLTLVPDSMTYRIRETYLNTGGGDKTFESAGTYAVNKGTVQDTDAVVYQLNPGDTENMRAFKLVNDSAVLMLDKNQNEITSALNYYLVRIRM